MLTTVPEDAVCDATAADHRVAAGTIETKVKRINYYITLLLVCTALYSSAQDSIVHRVILIGDAGQTGEGQQHVISRAASLVADKKTTVLFLGDNIYPDGMAISGSTGEQESINILRSQYMPMRSKGAAVYFIPGNHDWDRMGPYGLEKIQLQGRYLEAQQDTLLQLVPGNGCPDPYEISITNELVILALDSEWWLYPFNKQQPDERCECTTKDEVITRLEELLYRNRHKQILLATHHPFYSYGRHGGYFSFNDHVFPFTAIKKNLYIPLPVIGSLYPVLRKTFPNPEDMGHPLYKDLIRRINGATTGYPNLVQVSGHEHTIQMIRKDRLQVVSGAGAKASYVRKTEAALFGSANYGFVTADLLADSSLLFTCYIDSGNGIAPVYTYLQQYNAVQDAAAFNTGYVMGDSITLRVHPAFDSVSRWHRKLFGENYRKEYAVPTTLPVLRVSLLNGGLTPTKRGGGHQSRSLRLKDKTGKEWTLRSVDKYPEVLLPESLRETFAKDFVRDAMSAQHPFSALVVPVIATAAGVPHASPVIGFVAPDERLGMYSKLFANTVCLLEEREPYGKTDNTETMIAELNKDHDNTVDSLLFFRSRLLDLFLGDWDRHNDQWRWADVKKGSDKRYMPVPRDRDQVFHLTEGFFPKAASRPWVAPFLHHFDGRIRNVNAFYFSSRDLNSRFLNQLDETSWNTLTASFIAAITDSVLETALQQLPAAAYQLRHEMLLRTWQQRRANLAPAMQEYYRFLNRIVDLPFTDKNELIIIDDAGQDGLKISAYKLSAQQKIKECLYTRVFDATVTEEVRIFTGNGEDSIVFNAQHSGIRLRITGGMGKTFYHATTSGKKIQVYDTRNSAFFSGKTGKLRKHLSADSLNTVYIPTNLYNVTGPVFTGGYNLDDGIILGAGLKHIHQGFRKQPYSSFQQFTVAHSFSTDAWRLKYRGEWLKAIGKYDIVAQGTVFAPDNTQNFFGLGNETRMEKKGDFTTYYRARFNMYQGFVGLHRKNMKGTGFSIGPAFQYYHFDSSENAGRFILNTSQIGSYDSATLSNDKWHAGIVADIIHDKRNNTLLPTWGAYLRLRIQGFTGLNSYSRSFLQIVPEVALYTSLNAKSTIVIAERFGGLVSFGNTAFYQSAFLGGHDNLYGYRQFRFAGEHTLYNNLEVRIKLADVASYLLPGQFGVTGFFDIGRVWVSGEESDAWHHGVGGGIYFAPAQMALLTFIVGYSEEGWYPNISLGFRF